MHRKGQRARSPPDGSIVISRAEKHTCIGKPKN